MIRCSALPASITHSDDDNGCRRELKKSQDKAKQRKNVNLPVYLPPTNSVLEYVAERWKERFLALIYARDSGLVELKDNGIILLFLYKD